MDVSRSYFSHNVTLGSQYKLKLMGERPMVWLWYNTYYYDGQRPRVKQGSKKYTEYRILPTKPWQLEGGFTGPNTTTLLHSILLEVNWYVYKIYDIVNTDIN